ncbi:MAG: L,D-transpeptidase family protein [Verrucomicrobia bacterium]|nr:L,D-transpeptidase family protein [Verrucomicrobiota bacterium]
MLTPSLLFPAPVLPPEGCDLSIDENPESALEAWLAILPAGGPGYLLSPEACERNTANDHDEESSPDLLALLPPDPTEEATLGLDFRYLDRAMQKAWQSVPRGGDQSPAEQVETLFQSLSRELGTAPDWSTVWSWDSRGPGEIEICLRALCRNASAPVLYHEALPDVSGNSAREILAAGLLALLSIAPAAQAETEAAAPQDEATYESEGEFSGLLREIGKAPNKKQDPVRVNEALLKNMDGASVNIIVDRGAQRAYLIVDGAIAIDTPISSGTKGHTTPLGNFTILEKKRSGKKSTIYHCALPRWMRLTWQGVGMHVGDLPGYPASHGCIRLPEDGATALFDHTPSGTTVTVLANWTGTPTTPPTLLADN